MRAMAVDSEFTARGMFNSGGRLINVAKEYSAAVSRLRSFVFEKWTAYIKPRLGQLSADQREAYVQAAAQALDAGASRFGAELDSRLSRGVGLLSDAVRAARGPFQETATREKQYLTADLSLYMTTPVAAAGTNIKVVTSGANSPVNVGSGTLNQTIGSPVSMQDLAGALGTLLVLMDRHHSEDTRELRELVVEAKDEAEKAAPNGLRLKSILTGCRDTIQTFAALDPGWQGVQRIAQMLGLLG